MSFDKWEKKLVWGRQNKLINDYIDLGVLRYVEVK